MMIKTLYLRDFRNYKEATISFSSKINAIWGNNAQGKTNLLEALHLFVTGRSFRTSHLIELIRFGAHAFYLEILFEKNGIEQKLKFSFDGNERKIIHNATPLASLSTLLGILIGVTLSPEDRSLVKGGPSLRRHFLDLLLAQANPLYLHHLSRYVKAMKQRNFLLKKRTLETIAIWEEQMAHAAAFLTHHRSHTVADLEKLSQAETLASDQITLIYRSQALAATGDNLESLSHYFLRQFEKHRRRECDLGVTLSGPHRDDLSILLHSKEARQFASEGQQHSCVASLKLAQLNWLYALTGRLPILCIDDVSLSFDASREQELYQRMENLGQVFITSARPPLPNAYSIHIDNGQSIL
ncbi:MAG TPA: DNA replication/repair protein RecF [Waddliaceae bacterium]